MASPTVPSRGRRGPGDDKMVAFPMQQLFILGMFSRRDRQQSDVHGCRMSSSPTQIGSKELKFQLQTI